MNHWWRISRYDPQLRDAHGAFVAQTWTSISDVGRVFGAAGKLTMDQYVEVEEAYVDAVEAFAKDSEISTVRVTHVERGEEFKDGQLASLSTVRRIVREMLREEVWCRLEGESRDFAVHVGFDLYMYIGSNAPCESAVRKVCQSGLYVEHGFKSPQLEE